MATQNDKVSWVRYAAIVWFHDINTRVNSFGDPLADIKKAGDSSDKPLARTLANFDDEPVMETVPVLDAEGKPTVDAEGKPVTKDVIKTLDGNPPAGDKSNWVTQRVSNGWDTTQGTCDVVSADEWMKAKGITLDAFKVLVHEERLAIIAKLDAKDEYKGVAEVARDVWYKNGKTELANLHVPTDVGNECFRRSLGILGAIFLRRKEASEGTYKGETGYFIPVVRVAFKTELQRLLCHVGENEGKDVGRAVYSDVDRLGIAKRVFDNFGRESDLTRVGMKRGTAQKVWAIVELDNAYPALNLIKRLSMPKPEVATGQKVPYNPNGYIPFGPLNKEEMRMMLKGKPFDSKSNDTLTTDVTAEYVEGYVAKRAGGTPKVWTPMSPAVLEGLTKENRMPVHLVRSIVLAILKGNGEYFAMLARKSDALNTAISAVLTGDVVVSQDDTKSSDNGDDTGDENENEPESSQTETANS